MTPAGQASELRQQEEGGCVKSLQSVARAMLDDERELRPPAAWRGDDGQVHLLLPGQLYAMRPDVALSLAEMLRRVVSPPEGAVPSPTSPPEAP